MLSFSLTLFLYSISSNSLPHLINQSTFRLLCQMEHSFKQSMTQSNLSQTNKQTKSYLAATVYPMNLPILNQSFIKSVPQSMAYIIATSNSVPFRFVKLMLFKCSCPAATVAPSSISQSVNQLDYILKLHTNASLLQILLRFMLRIHHSISQSDPTISRQSIHIHYR